MSSWATPQLLEIGINCEVEAVDNITYEERGKKRNFDARVVDEASSLIDADSIATQFTPSRFDEAVWYPRAMEIYEMAQKGRGLQGEARAQLYGQIAHTQYLFTTVSALLHSTQIFRVFRLIVSDTMSSVTIHGSKVPGLA